MNKKREAQEEIAEILYEMGLEFDVISAVTKLSETELKDKFRKNAS